MAKVIAEIGINHNGQLKLVEKLIFMAKSAGADAIKFQKRDVETVYAGQLEDPRNDGNPYGWKTVGEQKHGIEFSIDEYKIINALCKKVGIPWFVSCWDRKSISEMETNFPEMPYQKIASAMVTNDEVCQVLADKQRYTFLSTGGCTLEQVQNAALRFAQKGPGALCIMHCVSIYPCPDNKLNLNMIHTLRRMFPWAEIGYSGHEVGLYPSIMAIAMGATWIERHITLDRSMYGSDQAASMEFKGLKALCDVAHSAPLIFGDGIKKTYPQETECMSKLRYWE